MGNRSSHDEPLKRAEPFHRGSLSLLALVESIVQEGDEQALREFHEHRTVFRIGGRPSVLFAEFLEGLRKRAVEAHWGTEEIVDRAYDLTLDKFCNLPSPTEERQGSEMGESELKQSRTDCRFYFRAFLGRVTELMEDEPPNGPLEEELMAADHLERLVVRHFLFSVKECKRRGNPLVTRHFWKTLGGTLCLLLPRHLPFQERREWLSTNVPDLDVSRPGERERVQAIIDERLLSGMRVPAPAPSVESPLPWSLVHSITTGGLAVAVAEEKAESIHAQRPAVRALGKDRLRQMILRIFEDLTNEEFHDGEVAAAFGLSRATFSRFAGSRWPGHRRGAQGVPDLWRNTAQTLAAHSAFVEAARDAGVWDRVEEILSVGEPSEGDAP